jgi:hypothetical protein
MSPKTLLRIGIVLGVLLLAWGGMALVRRARTDQPRGIHLPRLKEGEVDRIVMARPADTVVLTRTAAGEWQTGGAPVSEPEIESFFSALDDTTAGSELVAQSPSEHERMGVDSAKAKRLTLSSGGKPLFELWLGNHGPDFEGYFVRRPTEPEVYLYHGQFATLADQRVSDWRDPVIARLKPDSIAAVDVIRGSKRWSVRKAGPSWTLAGGKGAAVDSAAMARYLEQFAEIRAVGFPERNQADSARFTPPARRLTLLGADNHPLLALVFDSTYGGFWVRADSGGPLYKLDAQRANQLTPPDSSLRKK